MEETMGTSVLRKLRASSLLVLGAMLAVLFVETSPAGAYNTQLKDWQDKYGPGTATDSSSGDTAQCQLCHRDTNGGDPWNAYGWDLREARFLEECDLDQDGFDPNSWDECFRCV